MSWIRISFAEKAFTRLIGERGYEISTLTTATGLDAMMDFFEGYPAQHTRYGGEDSLVVRTAIKAMSITRRMKRSDNSGASRALVLTFTLKDAPSVDCEPLTFAIAKDARDDARVKKLRESIAVTCALTFEDL